MGEPTSCCRSDGGYCDRCDLLLGLEGLRVVAVDRDNGDDGGGALTVTVESAPGVMGCRTCGVVARGHGRLEVRLVDAPAMGRPVRICWRKRRWICPEPTCPVTTFIEQDERVAAPRAKLTTRACRWAIDQLRREHASVNGLRRQLGTGWRTVWDSIRPLLAAADADPARFTGVEMLGVDEHVWHHVSTKPVEDGGRGPKELTGMVDLTRDQHGHVHARLLDLVPGRSGPAYRNWLIERGEDFRAGVKIATLDPFHGYKNAIDDQLEDAIAGLDRSTSSSSPAPSSMTSAAGFSRTPPGTAAAATTRSTGSGTSSAPARSTSPKGSKHGCTRRSPPAKNTSRSRSPTAAPNTCAPASTKTATPPDDASPRPS